MANGLPLRAACGPHMALPRTPVRASAGHGGLRHDACTARRAGRRPARAAERRARAECGRGPQRRGDLLVLTWAIALFSAMRVCTYLPTMWAIQASGDSSQHSLWTRFTWAGANLTMAAWLYEHGDQRCNRAVAVNLVNAAMCLITSALIVALRL
jgi:hypothetical protein